MSNLLDFKNCDFPRYYLNKNKTCALAFSSVNQCKVFRVEVTSQGTYLQINDMLMDAPYLLQVEKDCDRVESPDFALFLDEFTSIITEVYKPLNSITSYYKN